MSAIRSGDIKKVMRMVDSGVCLDGPMVMGATPLTLAIHLGYTNIVRILLSRGANPWTEDAYGRSPIVIASSDGRVDVVRLLIDYGRLPYLQGEPLITYAISGGHIDMVILLLEMGIDTVADTTDFLHQTPLMLAARGGHDDIIHLLLDYGAEMNIQDSEGKTALIYAVLSKHLSTARLLLDKGADPCIRDNQGKDALDLAVTEDIRRVVYRHSTCIHDNKDRPSRYMDKGYSDIGISFSS